LKVVPLNLNSLKFVKCSNSVGMLLRDSHQNNLRVCNWVKIPICVGSDLILLKWKMLKWCELRDLWWKCFKLFCPIQFQHLKWRKLTCNYFRKTKMVSIFEASFFKDSCSKIPVFKKMSFWELQISNCIVLNEYF
jgi:hypothetical protein